MASKIFDDAAKALFDSVRPFDHRISLTPYEWIQVLVLTLTFLPVRIVLMIIFAVLSWFFAALGLIGVPFDELRYKPMNLFRRRYVKAVIWYCLRALFFVGGFYRFRTKGQQASRKEAPILVFASHSTFVDILPVLVVGGISVVSKADARHYPLYGKVITYTQPVYVDRGDKKSKKNTIEEIRRRALDPDEGWDQIVIFPEGTCTNRKSLITFKPGAFHPGLPVQPVCIRYPNKIDTLTWSWRGESIIKLLWLSLCQLSYNFEVELLPVYVPSEAEQQDAKLYAFNVRRVMAKAMDLQVSEWSYDDIRFIARAERKGFPVSIPLVKIIKFRSRTKLDSTPVGQSIHNCVSLLEDRSHPYCDLDEFAAFLSVPLSEGITELFQILDQEKTGKVDARGYVCGLWLLREDLTLPQRIDRVFRLFSTNHDSRVERNGFVVILWVLLNISHSTANLAFEKLDLDSTGFVSRDDFLEELDKAEAAKSLVQIKGAVCSKEGINEINSNVEIGRKKKS